LRDPHARVALVVAPRPHLAVHLRREDHLVAPALEGLAYDLLGLARGIHVGRVDEVDPAVDRRADRADAVVDVGVAPFPEHHRAEAVRADLEAGPAERSVLHRSTVSPAPDTVGRW